MDLQGLIAVLWRRKWILIIVPTIAMLSAFLVRFLGEWKFVSTAQLTTGLTVSDELIQKERQLNPYEVQVTFNNLIEVIRSRSVMGQVSYRLLQHDFSDSTHAFRKIDKKDIKVGINKPISEYINVFQPLLKNKLDSLTLLNPINADQKLLQKFIDAYGYDYETLLKNITINRLNQSDFIEISYSSEDADLSAFVVNTVCSEFIRYYVKARVSSSSISLESLESIAKQRREYLDSKIAELKNFKSRNDVINSAVESEAKINQIKSYEDQITEGQQKLRGLELTLANLNVRINDAEVSNGMRPNDQVVTLRKKINSVNERYIQGGQTDATLLDSLTHLRTQLDAALQRASESSKMTVAELNALRNKREESRVELEIARENLSSLNKVYSSMRYSIGNLANNEALGKALEKEVDVASEENQAAQNRLNEAKEKLVTNRVSISQVLIAEPAEKAQSRKTLVFMLFSGVLSFVICAAAIIGLELMDSRIKNATRFRQKTRLKLAGSLPQMPSTELNWEAVFDSGDDQVKINEEIRKIRFEIANHKARVILVSSLRQNQGKSFFIIALAYSLSLLKKRTLIIDTNLRNNSLTQSLLAQPNLRLLLDKFAQNTKLLGPGNVGQEASQRENTNPVFDEALISRTQNDYVDIIGNKKSQLSPSEVIPGGDFKVLLEWLKITYDYIILEGPALNSFSDSKELIRFVDLIVPVFSAESTVDAADTDSLNYLRSLQDKLGPAVLNNVEDKD